MLSRRELRRFATNGKVRPFDVISYVGMFFARELDEADVDCAIGQENRLQDAFFAG